MIDAEGSLPSAVSTLLPKRAGGPSWRRAPPPQSRCFAPIMDRIGALLLD